MGNWELRSAQPMGGLAAGLRVLTWSSSESSARVEPGVEPMRTPVGRSARRLGARNGQAPRRVRGVPTEMPPADTPRGSKKWNRGSQRIHDADSSTVGTSAQIRWGVERNPPARIRANLEME